jgi:hypothetical protein
MGYQFLVRSHGLENHLKVKSVVYDEVKVMRVKENGMPVFEIIDPDAIIELVIRRKASTGDDGLKENKDACKPKSNTSVVAGDDAVAVGGKRPGAAELDANESGFSSNESEEIVATKESSADQSTEKETVGRKKKKRKTDSHSASLSDGAEADEQHAADDVPESEKPSADENDTSKPSSDSYLSKAAAASALTTLAVKSANTKKDSVYDLRWNEQYNLLLAHKLEHGTCDGVKSLKLRQWISVQLRYFKKGHLTEKRAMELKKTGLLDAVEVDNYKRTKAESAYEKRMRMNWERRYNDLVEFKRAHGADSLPSKQEDNQLQHWVWFQRSEFRNGNMAADRIAKLDEIGVLTAIREERVLMKSANESRPEAKWNLRYNELAEFKREFGHLSVSRITHPELCCWAYYQSDLFRAGKLSDDKVARLNELGFIWDRLEEKWNTKYSQLLQFKQEHGHCNVPSEYEPNPNLATWANRLRMNFKDGKISAEHLAKLNEVEFCWEETEINSNEIETASSESEDAD